MPETYEKKDQNTLIVTYEESRAVIQNEIDQLERRITEQQKRIDELKAQIAVLDG